MQAHRIEAIVNPDKTLTLENLPFPSGEPIEIIILSRQRKEPELNRYPLRGTPIQYIDPTEPVT